MSNVTVAALTFAFSSRVTWTVIVALALLPGAATGGTSLSGSMRVRNTTVSRESAKTCGAASMPSRTTTHSLLIDFLTCWVYQGVGAGSSLADNFRHRHFNFFVM